MCNLLLENGAQINFLSTKVPSRTALMEAAKQNNLQVVELLTNKGANVNKVAPNNECTALSLAAQAGHSDVLKYMLEHGGNPNIPLKDQYTCLLEASKNGHTQCVELLLQYEPPNNPTSGQPAPGKQRQVLSVLHKIAKTYATNFQASGGVTQQKIATVKISGNTSAPPGINHDTALTLACVGGHTAVVKLLLGQGIECIYFIAILILHISRCRHRLPRCEGLYTPHSRLVWRTHRHLQTIAGARSPS
jgi:ankyrin repeat protein